MLPDIIGEKPQHSWYTEWAAMILELKQTNGGLTQRADGAWVAIRNFKWGSGNVAAGEVVDEAWIERHEPVEVLSDPDKSTANGWVPRAI